MRTSEQAQSTFLWVLLVLVFLKVLVDGIEGWARIAVLVGEVM